MPYIKQEDRIHLYLNGQGSLHSDAETPGELNFQITLLIKRYWEQHPNYQGINDVLGALEGAKQEFYRRVAVPYEQEKILQNGDVYE